MTVPTQNRMRGQHQGQFGALSRPPDSALKQKVPVSDVTRTYYQVNLGHPWMCPDNRACRHLSKLHKRITPSRDNLKYINDNAEENRSYGHKVR